MWFGGEALEFRIKILTHSSTLKIEAEGAADSVTYVRQSMSQGIPQHRYLPMYNVTIIPS
jgi:glycine cleavage system regulatory protein